MTFGWKGVRVIKVNKKEHRFDFIKFRSSKVKNQIRSSHQQQVLRYWFRICRNVRDFLGHLAMWIQVDECAPIPPLGMFRVYALVALPGSYRGQCTGDGSLSIHQDFI